MSKDQNILPPSQGVNISLYHFGEKHKKEKKKRGKCKRKGRKGKENEKMRRVK
jgi:hypothetical protein